MKQFNRILITGASGYIGRRLSAAALAQGLEVVAAVREPRRCRRSEGLQVVRFDLSDPGTPVEIPADIDAVIHLAAIIREDSQPPGVKEDLNVSGTRRLLEATRHRKIRRFLFLSSQSARPDSPTRYGRAKWDIERLLNHPGEVIVRPGMVSGGPPMGVYGLLFRLIKQYPMLPIVRPDAPVYPIGVDDLCHALLAISRSDNPLPSIVRIAPETSMPFAAYVHLLARQRVGKRVRLVPIPTPVIRAISRITELIPFLPTVSRERVEGLIALPSMEPEASEKIPGMTIRPITQVFSSEGRRRRLIAEGRVLISYLLQVRAPVGAVIRYVRALGKEKAIVPLEIPQPVKLWPALLRALEPLPGKDETDWSRRLSLATRIAEMTPIAATKFHNYRDRPLVLSILVLAWTLATETVLLPIRWSAGLVSRFRR